jgi:hypothetical protein
VNSQLKGFAMRFIPAFVLLSAVSLAAATPSFASTTEATTAVKAISAPAAIVDTTNSVKNYVVAQTNAKKKKKKKKKA